MDKSIRKSQIHWVVGPRQPTGGKGGSVRAAAGEFDQSVAVAQ